MPADSQISILKRCWPATMSNFYSHQHHLVIRKQAFTFKTIQNANVFHLKSEVSSDGHVFIITKIQHAFRGNKQTN